MSTAKTGFAGCQVLSGWLAGPLSLWLVSLCLCLFVIAPMAHSLRLPWEGEHHGDDGLFTLVSSETARSIDRQTELLRKSGAAPLSSHLLARPSLSPSLLHTNEDPSLPPSNFLIGVEKAAFENPCRPQPLEVTRCSIGGVYPFVVSATLRPGLPHFGKVQLWVGTCWQSSSYQWQMESTFYDFCKYCITPASMEVKISYIRSQFKIWARLETLKGLSTRKTVTLLRQHFPTKVKITNTQACIQVVVF
ncbi:hypothetical protein QOT17_006241 [Balamuthia mandrillaris]